MSIMQSTLSSQVNALLQRLPDPPPAKADPAVQTPIDDGDQGSKQPPFELPYTPHFPLDFPRGGNGPSQPTYTDADLYGPQDPNDPESPEGPNPDDIDQDSIGDCYFVATLSAMAGSEEGRAQIEDAITYDPATGNFTVTLYGKDANGNPVEQQVTVTQADVQDNIDRNGGSRVDNGGGPLWPAVMEAAYAKMHYQDATANGQTPDPRLDGGYGPGSADKLDANGKPVQAVNPDGTPKFDSNGNPVYEQVEVGGISGGFATDAYFTLTGKDSTTFQAPSGDGKFGNLVTTVRALQIQQALENGQPVTVAVAPESGGEPKDGLAGGHQYSVQSIYRDETTGEWMVVLRNPWANNANDEGISLVDGDQRGDATITVPLDSIHTDGYQGFVIGDE